MTETSTYRISEHVKDHFRCFARNGRWGTCDDCPRSSEGQAFLEACRHTERYDHILDVDELTRLHKVSLK